ncbi:MAG TPA: ABC transporter ATP-binding protein, partial [bacterium]|nr:ABC transporter ATP-binding protein [bacterium]
ETEVTLRTSWSPAQTLNPGDYDAVFREHAVILAAGRYQLVIGLSSYERTFHYVRNAGILEVAGFAEGIDLVRVSNTALVLNPMTVDIMPTKGGSL